MTRASCLYQGTVRHRRRGPVENAFTYRVFMLYLDLGELDTVFAKRLLWSTRRPAPARWRRSDHPGDAAQPLDDWVRGLVGERTGSQPAGPVRLLTHLRYGGRGFNPISVYYCFGDDGVTLEWAVLEVTSTPWHERTHHVLDMRGGGGVHAGEVSKTMHVSPFLPMALDYRWRLSPPGERVSVGIDVVSGDQVVLETGLSLRRREINAPTLAAMLISHPPMSLRVVGGIYWQALRLWGKGVPYHQHPSHRTRTESAAP